MYEKPEEISLELIEVATALAVTALAKAASGHPLADTEHMFVRCSAVVQEQFDYIRDAVDDYSTEENTELLTIKIKMLRQALKATHAMLADPRAPIDDEELLDRTLLLFGKCARAVCRQYEFFQMAYFRRNPTRRPRLNKS